MSEIKLTELNKHELNERQMRSLYGGVTCICSCTTCYGSAPESESDSDGDDSSDDGGDFEPASDMRNAMKDYVWNNL